MNICREYGGSKREGFRNREIEAGSVEVCLRFCWFLFFICGWVILIKGDIVFLIFSFFKIIMFRFFGFIFRIRSVGCYVFIIFLFIRYRVRY